MNLKFKLIGAVFALASWVFPGMAQAAIVTYDFSVTATSGSLLGTSASGVFSFDTAAAPAGAYTDGSALLTFLDFTWGGIHYDETSANTGAIIRAVNGDLTTAMFGNQCSISGVCSVSSGSVDWVYRGGLGTLNDFAYSDGRSIGFGSSTTTLRATEVPEPTSVALLGLGFAVLGLMRRRDKN